jgi:hypothetical protein
MESASKNSPAVGSPEASKGIDNSDIVRIIVDS